MPVSQKFPEIQIFYKIQKSLDILECPKMSRKFQKNLPEKKKTLEKQKLLGIVSIARDFFSGELASQISVANIVF